MLHSNAFHEFQPRVGSFPTPFISDMAEAASVRSVRSNAIIVSLLRTSYYKRIGLERIKRCRGSHSSCSFKSACTSDWHVNETTDLTG